MSEVHNDDDDYKVLSTKLKDEANLEFLRGNIEKSIDLYTQAITIDPDNHILYSNRSASYMKLNSISKSLHDAEKCLELNPNFVKGYNRLGLAQQHLTRYEAAIDTYKKGIKLDPNNTAIWSLLNSCQEAADKKKLLPCLAAQICELMFRTKIRKYFKKQAILTTL